MTKDDLKKLYDAKTEAGKAVDAARTTRETFADDLAYQIASIKFGRAVNAYDDAVRQFAAEQVSE